MSEQKAFDAVERSLHNEMYTSMARQCGGILRPDDILELMARAAEKARELQRPAFTPKPKRERPPKAEDTSPVVLEFLCSGGETWLLRKALLDDLKQAYPLVDAHSAMHAARAYAKTNHKYTLRGMPAFIRSWFAREQFNIERRGPRNPPPTSGSPSSPPRRPIDGSPPVFTTPGPAQTTETLRKLRSVAPAPMPRELFKNILEGKKP